MEPRISGTYVTKRGNTYAYDGFWRRVENKIAWNAKVRQGGNVISTPSGVLEEVQKDTDIDRLVKNTIETTIENKIGAGG